MEGIRWRWLGAWMDSGSGGHSGGGARVEGLGWCRKTRTPSTYGQAVEKQPESKIKTGRDSDGCLSEGRQRRGDGQGINKREEEQDNGGNHAYGDA